MHHFSFNYWFRTLNIFHWSQDKNRAQPHNTQRAKRRQLVYTGQGKFVSSAAVNTQPKKFRRRCDGHTNITTVKKLLMEIDSRLSERTGVKDIMRAAGLLEWLHEEYCTHQKLIQAIANHGLDAAPNGINCCSCHDNTIGQNYFTIPISDD